MPTKDLKSKNELNYLHSDRDDAKERLEELVTEMAKLTTNETILVDGCSIDSRSRMECFLRNLPPNVKLIYSCDRNKKDLIEKILGDEVWYKLELENFDNPCSKQFVESYLEKYNKVRTRN